MAAVAVLPEIEIIADRCIRRHGGFRHANHVGFCDSCRREVVARLRGEAAVRPTDQDWEQGVKDAAEGVERSADRRPALMNPDTMRHIAANIPLWADHARFLRLKSAAVRVEE